MQDAVREHPSLRILGKPSFLFSFTSDEFDVYLVNDFLAHEGVAYSTASSTPTRSTWR